MNKTIKKIIGVTPRIIIEDGVEKEFVNRNYIEALQKRDANVLMITLNNPQIEDILALCDGFLVTGGSDMDPSFYGETNEEGLSKGVRPELDIVDKQVIEYAAKNGVPTLGICRGHQSINVVLGGTLYQHIGDAHKGVKYDQLVNTTKNRLLDFDEVININSYHHQAINKVAPEMEVIATHEDGTVEAIIHKTLPIIGVQWHPEKLQDTKPSQIIFDKFFDLIDNFNKN